MLWLLLTSTILFKWTDEKGNLHVTDRLASVPAKYRAAFAKKAEEAEKKRKASPPPAPQAAAPPANTDAYEAYLARQAAEKAIREQAAKLRDKVGDARKKTRALEEEYGNLASNPVMNAAVPARKQRMEEIQKEIEAANGEAEASLEALREMFGPNVPDEWITGS